MSIVISAHQPLPSRSAASAIGEAAAIGGLEDRRLELGEGLGLRIEAQRAVGRRRPDIALAVVIDRGRAAGGRHALRRHEDVDLAGLGIEPGEPAAAGIAVEPQDALRIAGHAVGEGGEAVGARHLEVLDLAGLGVDAADGGVVVGRVGGEPQIAVEIGPGIVDDGAAMRRRALRPVAAVVRLFSTPSSGSIGT